METKTFDCVDMKRRGAESVQERLRDKSEEEVRRFWKDRTEALRRRQAKQRGRGAASSSTS